MTTDLTGNFEVDEEEFDWDVFLPDPDEAEIAAEAAALEDGDELDLDDSHLDWEAALEREPTGVAGADGDARAGAAFDRIVDTVRRSFEEPEPEVHGDLVSGAEQRSGAEAATGLGAAADSWTAATFEDEVEVEVEWEPDGPALWTDPEPRAERGWQAAQEPEDELTLENEVVPFAEAPPEPDEVEREPEFYALLAPEPDGTAEGVVTAEPDPISAAAADLEVPPAGAAPVGAAPVGAAPVGAAPVEAAPAALWERDGESLPAQGPAHARGRKHRDGNEHSRVFTAIVVLACLVLVLVAAAALVPEFRHPATTTVSPPAHPAPAVPSSPGAARIQTATDAIDSATTAARVGLTSLASFPTPSNVATVINPYISSLQLYEAFLAGSDVPPSARSAAVTAEAQGRQDLRFLGTLEGLPPAQLGAYLGQFDTDATQLQTTLAVLEQQLGGSTS